MAFTPMGDFTFNHADNIDKPNKSASTNKSEFDSRGAELKTALNAVIALLNAVTDGASGADNIGMTAITETGANTTVQSIIEALITRLKAVTDSASGADLIGSTAISGVTGTTVQAQLESIKGLISDASETAKGIVELATTAETTTGTDDTRAVHPKGLKVELDKKIANTLLTTQGDIMYASSANTPARLGKGTAGQVLTMNAGATAPEWADAAGGTETWTTVDAFTRTADTTYTVTDNAANQAIHAIGRPIRYKATAGSYVYGIITGYTTGTVTLAGAPMTTEYDDVLEYGDFTRVVPVEVMIPTTFASGGASSTLLNTFLKTDLAWRMGKAYLVRFLHIVDTDDSGANQTRVNVNVNGSAVGTANSNAGPAIAETWTATTADINTSNYDINLGEAIEITCDANGTNDDAKELTVSMTFVLA